MDPKSFPKSDFPRLRVDGVMHPAVLALPFHTPLHASYQTAYALLTHVITVWIASPAWVEGRIFLARVIRRANARIDCKWLVLHRVMLGEAAEEEDNDEEISGEKQIYAIPSDR